MFEFHLRNSNIIYILYCNVSVSKLFNILCMSLDDTVNLDNKIDRFLLLLSSKRITCFFCMFIISDSFLWNLLLDSFISKEKYLSIISPSKYFGISSFIQLIQYVVFIIELGIGLMLIFFL